MSDISGNGYIKCDNCEWDNTRLYLHPMQCPGTPTKQEAPYVVRDPEVKPSPELKAELSIKTRMIPAHVQLSEASKTVEIRTTSSTGGEKGVKLERHDLIPKGPMKHLATHYGRGARKYDDHQWRKGYEFSKSIGALYRHFTDWENGIDYDTCANSNYEGCSLVDKDGNEIDWAVEGEICYNHTGGHHLDAVMWHSFTLREFVDTHPEHDDRFAVLLAKLSEKAKETSDE